MRICYVNPAILLRRPIAQILQMIAKEHEVALLIPKHLGKPLDNSLHYSDLPPNVKVFTYSVIQPTFLPYEWPIPVTPMLFIHLVRVYLRYDIIHMWAHFYLVNFFCAVLGLFFKNKLILTMDTVAGYSFSAGKKYDVLFRLYYKLFGWVIFGSPARITLYGKSLIPYAKQAGIATNKVRVITTGIHVSSKRIGDPVAIRKEFKLKDEKILLFVGLLVPRKGVDILLKIMCKLTIRDFKLFVIGDGPNRRRYEELAKELGLDDRVIFTGFRKDVFNFYSVSHLFVFPSRGEGLPGVIMESMVTGLPVVASKIPCIPELVKDGKSGYLCPNDDIECFKQRIEKLLKDENLRKKFSEEGFKIIQNFDWKKVIIKYRNLYKEIINASQKRTY